VLAPGIWRLGRQRRLINVARAQGAGKVISTLAARQKAAKKTVVDLTAEGLARAFAG